jgi:hypothetical protein
MRMRVRGTCSAFEYEMCTTASLLWLLLLLLLVLFAAAWLPPLLPPLVWMLLLLLLWTASTSSALRASIRRPALLRRALLSPLCATGRVGSEWTCWATERGSEVTR